MARYLYSYKLAHVDENTRKGFNTKIFHEGDFEFTDFDEVCDVAKNIVENETEPIVAFIYQYENKRGISCLDPFATWCVWSIANTRSADANEYVIDENSEVKPTNESRRPRGRMLKEESSVGDNQKKRYGSETWHESLKDYIEELDDLVYFQNKNLSSKQLLLLNSLLNYLIDLQDDCVIQPKN